MLLMECESGFRQDETTHKFVGLTLPYHFRGIMLYWGSMKPTGHSYFVLCYLTYLSVVAFNGVGGVYRLRIAGVYWKCSVRRSQLSHHDFMTMGYVSPHLLSSVSNCVSAVSLLTAPYTVLRSRRNSFWCLLPMCLIELRIWWTNTELDTCIGEYALYGIREAFQTINAAYQYIPDTSVLKIA